MRAIQGAPLLDRLVAAQIIRSTDLRAAFSAEVAALQQACKFSSNKFCIVFFACR